VVQLGRSDRTNGSNVSWFEADLADLPVEGRLM
jgi:hypothetical protein